MVFASMGVMSPTTWMAASDLFVGCFVVGRALLLVVREARCTRPSLLDRVYSPPIGSVAPNSGVRALVLDQWVAD